MTAARHALKRFTIASFMALAIPTAYAAGPADNPGDGAPPPPADAANCPPPPPPPGGPGEVRGPRGPRGPDQVRGPGGPGAMEEGPIPPFLRGLDLTEAQRDRIFEITHAQAPLMRQKSKEARTAHEALRDLAMSAQYDEGRARALAAEDAKASADLALMRVRTEHEIFALLTPEQRKAVQEPKGRFPEGHGPDRKGPPLPPNS
jgi:periplasmic protein CpxP/Spy